MIQKAENKECGSCALCCKLPRIEVPELTKAPNTWCHHCKPGLHACQIYESRPTICEEYVCMWLADPVMPDNLRPDKCKAIFFMASPIAVQCMIDKQSPPNWRSGPVHEAIEKFRENGYHVIIIRGSERTFLNGKGASIPPEIMDMVEAQS